MKGTTSTSTMRQPQAGRDYFRAPWCYLIWGAPAVLAGGAGQAYQASAITSTALGSIYVAAVAWIGIACFLNGRSCGRVHCKIDGIAFPILSVVGAMNVLSFISIPWNAFWLAFVAILISSFVPEFAWRKYTQGGRGEGVACGVASC